MEPRQELSDELRKARGWILAVGIIMFVVDQILLRAVNGDRIPAVWQTRFLIADVIILAYFVALWWFAQYKPKVCCMLALLGYWGLQIGVAAWVGDVASIFTNGIVIKVLFTMALIRGLKSATRAEYLKKDLENVFG